MKRPILLLTGAALILAASSAGLLQQVRTERARAQAEATLRAQWEARFRELERARSPPETAKALPPAASASPAAAADTQQERTDPTRKPRELAPAARAWLERLLAQLASPVGHSQLVAEEKMTHRSDYPDLAKQLHLTAVEEDKLLSAFAEQELKLRARSARCQLDSSCDPTVPYETPGPKDLVRDLLGADKLDEFQRYRETVPQRLQVRELRSRLDAANALSDEQAEALIAAMHEESERFEAEAQSTGRGLSSFGSWTGTLMAAPVVSGSPPSVSETMSSAQDFARRIRERAAELLSAEQMRQFDAIQQEQLAGVQSMLRSEPRVHGAAPGAPRC